MNNYQYANEEEYGTTPIGVVICKESKFNAIINPDTVVDGDCYFKLYNANLWFESNKFCRILFTEPKYASHRDTDELGNLILSDNEKHALIDFLNSDNGSGYTKWEVAKFDWNYERISTLEDDIDAYIAGEFDEKYKDNPNYLPITLPIPDYTQL